MEQAPTLRTLLRNEAAQSLGILVIHNCEKNMTIKLAHLRTQGIDFAVFDADSNCRSQSGRARILGGLTAQARLSGLRVDKSALAFSEHGRLTFFGSPDLVRYLSGGWLPQWTHTINV